METVRERLERLKNRPLYGPSPIYRSNPEKKLLTPETQYIQKVEKSMEIIENLRTKMHSGTDQYLSLYLELKKAEDDFLLLLVDPERQYMDLPNSFLNRVEIVKKQLLTKKF